MEHTVVADVVNLRHGTDVAGYACINLSPLLPLQLQQMANLERLSGGTNVELAVGTHRSLMDPEHAKPPDERVDGHSEHMRKHGCIRRVTQLHDLTVMQKLDRITFKWVWHQLLDNP